MDFLHGMIWGIGLIGAYYWFFGGNEKVFDANRRYILGCMGLLSYPENRETGTVYVIRHANFEVVGDDLGSALKKLIPTLLALQKSTPPLPAAGGSEKDVLVPSRPLQTFIIRSDERGADAPPVQGKGEENVFIVHNEASFRALGYWLKGKEYNDMQETADGTGKPLFRLKGESEVVGDVLCWQQAFSKPVALSILKSMITNNEYARYRRDLQIEHWTKK